jgi:hypothetical protein
MTDQAEIKRASNLRRICREARYLLDVFIEGGYVEMEDIPHINRLHDLLTEEGWGVDS